MWGLWVNMDVKDALDIIKTRYPTKSERNAKS